MRRAFVKSSRLGDGDSMFRRLMILDVFGADAYAYEAGEEAAEGRMGREEAQDQGWFDGRGVAEDA